MVALSVEESPLEVSVRALEATLDAMPAEAWAGLESTLVRGLVARLGRVEARLGAQKVAAARRLESTGAARAAGATSTGDLLARDFGGDRAAGDRVVKTAQRLAAASRTEAALAAGDVSLAQAQVIADGLDRLPAGVTADQKMLAERVLLRDAADLNLKELRRRVDRAADAYASRDEVDAIENQTLEDRERRARAKSRFRMWDNRDGTWSGDFTIPEAQADMLKTAVDVIAAPRREHLQTEQATDPVNRNGRAFADLLSHLPTDGLPSAGGVGAVITVNLDHATLVAGIRPATLSTGTRISAGQARALACRVGVLPMVFDGSSVPLDLGREKRLFTSHQRAALAARDGGCAFPSCDRPPQWTEVHHWREAWARGGSTDLADGVLLCPHHHRIVEGDGYDLRERDGHIEFRHPASQVWRVNRRYRP